MKKKASQAQDGSKNDFANQVNKIGGFGLTGKYKELIWSLTALFFGLGLVVVLTLYFSEQSTKNTEHTDLIGDISDSALFISSASQRLALVPEEDVATIEELSAEIEEYATEIDGYVASLEGYDKQETAMSDFAHLWQSYRKKINNLDGTLASRAELADYAYEQQSVIWDYIDVGYETYLAEAFKYNKYTTWLHFLTFLGLLAYLAFVVGYAFRRINRLDMQVAQAQQQTNDILNTVSEGLFLINKDMVLSDVHSKSLERILNKKNLQGKSLHQLLNGAISKDDLEATKLFVEQLYNPWVVEELIQDLNPLKQIKVSQITSEGYSIPKYLDFNFLRVIAEGKDEVNHVFVSVVDVTKAVQLQQAIDKSKEQHERELEMIAVILTVEYYHLKTFIDNTKERIEKMNNTLKLKSDASVMILKAKAREIFRETHSLKGEASALGLKPFVDSAEHQESQLNKLLEKGTLSGDDFLPFTVGLNELLEMIQYIESIIEKLRLLGNIQPEYKLSHIESKWQSYFKDYANEMAARHNKQISVSVIGFDENAYLEQFNVYKDIAVQFLKNAIVHGIETPQERLLKGKPQVGKVTLKLEKQYGEISVSIEDDGRGIDAKAIRQKAISLGLISQEKAQTLGHKELYALMLKTGVSTAKSQTEDAGRGVGMSIIWELARANEGKLEMNSSPEKYTRMAVNFIDESFYQQG